MTNTVENTGTGGVIGVVISDGEVKAVSVNNAALEGVSVVIIEDGSANKLMRTGLDDNVTTYMEAAREQNAKTGTALVSKLAGDHLLEISKTSYSSSQEMAQEMADALDHAIFLLNKARSGDLPADEVQVPTATAEVVPKVSQIPLEAPVVVEQEDDQEPAKAVSGQRRTRLNPIW